ALSPWASPDPARPATWAERPPAEKPRDALGLPDIPDGMMPLGTGSAGVESLLVLARAAPLTDADHAELQRRLTGLPKTVGAAVRAAYYLRDGELGHGPGAAQDDGDRGAPPAGPSPAGPRPVPA